MIIHDVSALLDAMAKAGASPIDGLPDSTGGGINRFRVEGDEHGCKSGWIVFFADNAGCCFGNWKTGSFHTYFFNSNSDNSDEEYSELRKKAKAARELALSEQHRQIAKECLDIWHRSLPASNNHTYLKRKRISAFGCRQFMANLAIPLHDENGHFQSLQFIKHDGSKRFKSGSKAKGGRFWIGKPTESSPILLCEGFATAATLHQATGLPVVACFNAGNLEIVLQSIQQQHPACLKYICADNDHKNADNTGLDYAYRAASTGLAKVIYPPTELLDGGSDFNDMAQHLGINAVRSFIREKLRE